MIERNVAFVICTSCTLNCRLCASCAPLFKQKGISIYLSPEDFRREMEGLFQVYEYVETISISGGEPLLHHELAELVRIALYEFSARFNCLRIITNGTVRPNESLLDVVNTYSNGNVEFQISDYGTLSNQIRAVVESLKKCHIPYRIKGYHEDEQYRGGWIDYGPLDKLRPYSPAEAQHILDRCRMSQEKCLNVIDGKLTLCCRAAAGHQLGFFTLNPDEYIDLLGDTQPIDVQKEIAMAFGQKPSQACYYCNGFDMEDSERFNGAEQAE